MKIRWTQNSVRFRITPAELETLNNAQPVSAALLCGAEAIWSASLLPTTSEGAPAESTVSFAAGVLLVRLTRSDLQTLAAPDSEGVYLGQDGLRFAVEKDFPCAHASAATNEEPPTATFPPPDGFRSP